jgi:putative ABC transport system permease protein
MKPLDIFRLIFSNLSRQKGRVALTAIGVVIGTAAVVILVSLAIGLQRNANEQLYAIGDLKQIQVMPAYGEGMVVQMGGPGGGGGGGGVGQPDQPRLLTNSALDEMRVIPGVQSVIPRDFLMAEMLIKYQKMEAGVGIIGVETDDLTNLGLEATEGSTMLSRGNVVIGLMVPNNFYDPHQHPGQEVPPPPQLLGQQIQLVVTKYDEQGNPIRKNLSLHVSGILKETRGESDWSMYLPLAQIKALNEWAQGRRINYNKEGYGQVVVKVQDVDQVLDISDQITEMGFQAYTLQDYVQGLNNFYMILQVSFGGVGTIALLVAAIGIANTMAMSILERTREIGLMKAVGATNRDVLAIFLGEAAGIGFIGGLGGVIIGWLAGQAINVAALVYLASQAGQQGGLPPSVAVYTPFWLPLFVLVFSTIIGMISGLYPALRAATMIPVMALKYE